MKILAYDTSSEVLSIALFDGERKVGEFESPLFTRHSSTLAPSLDVILKAHNMELADIDIIAVGLGPGSFTGLRVGIVTAKVLAWTLKKKLVGVSSLEAIAYGAPADGDGAVAVMLDAKKNKIYAAIYRVGTRGRAPLRPIKKPMLVGVDHFLSMIRKPASFVGDGAILHRDKILHLGRNLGKIVEDKVFPKAANVVRAAMPLIKKKKFIDPFKLDPLYLHSRTCNVVIKAKG